MSIVGNDKPQHHVVLYFDYQNGEVAKNFAARMRNSDGVKVTLVWSMKFSGEQDVLGGIGAVVIEAGCQNADSIVRCYQKWSPNTEIHFMTPDGSWSDEEAPKEDAGPVLSKPTKEAHADEDTEGQAQSAVPSEAGTPTAAADDLPDQEPEFEEIDDADSNAEPVSDTADADVDAGEPAADGDAERAAQEG